MKFIKAPREAEKSKLLLEETLETYGVTDETKGQVPRQRPRNRGMKRALELEKKREVELANKLTFNEQLAIMINEDRENCLDRANQHLEKLLDKARKYNDIYIRMEKHYSKRNNIARSKLKRENEKIETLTMQKDEGRLHILVEASLHA